MALPPEQKNLRKKKIFSSFVIVLCILHNKTINAHPRSIPSPLMRCRIAAGGWIELPGCLGAGRCPYWRLGRLLTHPGFRAQSTARRAVPIATRSVDPPLDHQGLLSTLPGCGWWVIGNPRVLLTACFAAESSFLSVISRVGKSSANRTVITDVRIQPEGLQLARLLADNLGSLALLMIIRVDFFLFFIFHRLITRVLATRPHGPRTGRLSHSS